MIGPAANSTSIMNGGYGPIVNPKYAQTPLQGLRKLSKSVHYERGCPRKSCESYNEDKVKEALKDAEVVFFSLIGGKV